MKDKMLAICMAFHRRLGEKSVVSSIDISVFVEHISPHLLAQRCELKCAKISQTKYKWRMRWGGWGDNIWPPRHLTLSPNKAWVIASRVCGQTPTDNYESEIDDEEHILFCLDSDPFDREVGRLYYYLNVNGWGTSRGGARWAWAPGAPAVLRVGEAALDLEAMPLADIARELDARYALA